MFLAELVANGYVKDEAVIRAEMAARRAAAKPKAGPTKKLFGSLSITAPSKPSPVGAAASPAATTKNAPAAKKKPMAPSVSSPVANSTGQVLLMRVRKARGTQVQIPLAVMRTPFFTGATQVFSVASNVTRGIHPTHAARAKTGANPNTLKLEMPETQGLPGE